MKPDIMIICPKCSSKAAFYSQTVVRQTMLVPSIDGRVVCSSCGLNRLHTFSSKDYFFRIEVDGRSLYARTIENVVGLRAYFKDGTKQTSDPELDFPKVFYERREEIVRKLDVIIRNESPA